MNLQPVAVLPEPGPDVLVLMIGSVVLDQDGTSTTVALCKVLQEGEIRLGVEDLLGYVHEPGTIELDGAQDLDVFTFSGDRDLWWMADSCPGCVQGGVLPEARLVGEDQSPVFPFGFFLMLG